MSKKEAKIKEEQKKTEEQEVDTNENLETKEIEQEAQDVSINKDQFNKLEEKYNKIEHTYQRLLADYENTKRRNAKEVMEARNKGKIEVIENILDIVDNFERSMQFDAGTEEFKNGMTMLLKMFNERLEAVGLEEVRHEGELDPNIHQAIAVENNEKLDDDIITEVLQKGYRVEDKVVRPAMVKVNKKEK